MHRKKFCVESNFYFEH